MSRCKCSDCTRSRVARRVFSLSVKPKRPTLRGFIRENRAELDAAIRRACPNASAFNDDERRLWILNDEGLYLWAKGEGVNV